MKTDGLLKMSMSRTFTSWILSCLLGVSTLFLVSCASTHGTNSASNSSNSNSSNSNSASGPMHTMTLSDHEFAPVDFVPKAGDRIVINNHSDISHSIYVTYPDGSMVNLGVQTPGTTVTWTVPDDAKGAFLLQCWIHPVIRATLDVNDSKLSSSVSPASPVVSSGLFSQELRNGRQNICSSRNRRT